jgi:tetratricopeptide (TPR) repeat protein
MTASPLEIHMLRAPSFRSSVVAWMVLLLVLFVVGPASAHGDLDRQIAEVTARIAAQQARPVNVGTRAVLHFERGELHRLHGDWARAEADYDMAIRYQPDLHPVDLGRGRMLLDMGRPRDAKAVLERFLRNWPNHPEGLLVHAQILVKLGWGGKAVRFIDQAIARISQPEPDYYLARVEILVSLGPAQLSRAVAGLDEGIARLGPVVALETRAIELDVELGRWASALSRVDRQAAATIRKDLWLARRADILDSAGRRAEARASRQQALQVIASLPPPLRTRKTTVDLEQQLVAALGR